MIQTVEDFDDIIRKVWGTSDGLPIIVDGIVNLEKYNKSNPKILWILKEGNENEPKKERNHREFHEDVTVYKNWRSTYEKLILSTYELLHDCDYDSLPVLNKNATMGEENENVLLNIALININKNGGNNKANRTNIEKNYSNENKRKVLHAQIKEMNPDVIINCSRVARLYNDISSPDFYNLKKENFNGIQYSYNKDKLFIDYYHPCCTRTKYFKTQEEYCTNLISIYRQWKSLK